LLLRAYVKGLGTRRGVLKIDFRYGRLCSAHIPTQDRQLKPLGGVWMNRTSTATVVIEWYNLNYAESGRAIDLIAALARQQQEELQAASSGRGPLASPLEVIIAFDSSRLAEREVRDFVEGLPGSAALDLRLAAVPGGTYCQLKNAGARAATGDLLLFLDSDVVIEPGWLRSMLRAFSDPRVKVVVGNTYVDLAAGSAYVRTMALTWMFPLRDASDKLTKSGWFYANNLGFRREAFLSNPFIDTPGLIHAPAATMVRDLAGAGTTIWHCPMARASHPAPNGIAHFFRRAIAGGRARSLTVQPDEKGRLLGWIVADFKSMLWGWKRILLERQRVALGWWQVPAALAVATAYGASFLLGSALAEAFPHWMSRRFVM
jgi:hypothetical protein